MASDNFLQLPDADPLSTADVIAAVQGGLSGDTVQMTLGQVLSLGLVTNTLSYAGNPNSNVAGTVLQLCLDTSSLDLYICTTGGSASTAVWTLIGNNLILPAQGGTGVASPTAHTLPVAEGSSAFNFLGPLTNGQLLIGSTSNDPAAATITAGTNVSVSNGAGTITIAATGHASFSWTNVTGPTQTMAANAGYLGNSGGLITFTLPTTAAQFSEIEIVGCGAGAWTIAQGASQQIVGPGFSTTVGAGGSISSTDSSDTISLICTTANTTWHMRSAVGGIYVVI